MDDAILLEILSGRHFDMDERVERGIWPHPPIQFADVVQVLARVIRERQWFPREYKPDHSGEWVPDVTAIENCGADCIRVHYQRAGAFGNTVAAGGTQEFSSAADAAVFFLRSEFHLPGDLDGWKVVGDDTIGTSRQGRAAIVEGGCTTRPVGCAKTEHVRFDLSRWWQRLQAWFDRRLQR